jgi:hypothetical protein
MFNFNDRIFLAGNLEAIMRSPRSLEKLKIAIAREYHLPDHKHVNVVKALAYLRWKESDEGRMEAFLAGLGGGKQE